MAGAPGSQAHEHSEACAELFGAWHRYHAVVAAVEDASGRFTSDDRLAAARERDMFRRQLDALGCDPEALLVLEENAG